MDALNEPSNSARLGDLVAIVLTLEGEVRNLTMTAAY